jgi:hypothetical protein
MPSIFQPWEGEQPLFFSVLDFLGRSTATTSSNALLLRITTAVDCHETNKYFSSNEER